MPFMLTSQKNDDEENNAGSLSHSLAVSMDLLLVIWVNQNKVEQSIIKYILLILVKGGNGLWCTILAKTERMVKSQYDSDEFEYILMEKYQTQIPPKTRGALFIEESKLT